MRTLTVPLDYRHPAGRTIKLAVLKVPASGSRIGSLVVNPGGPGASGRSYAAAGGAVLRRPTARALRHRRLRPARHGRQLTGRLPGRRGARPVPCGRTRPRRPPPRWRRTRRHAARLVTGCSRRSGDAGGPRVDGRVGARHGHPAGGARRVDDGLPGRVVRHRARRDLRPAVPRAGRPVRPRRGHGPDARHARALLQQAKGFQTALDAYAANCVQSAVGCFLGKDVAGVEQTISAILDQIDGAPAAGRGGRDAHRRRRVLGIGRRCTTAPTGSCSAQVCAARWAAMGRADAGGRRGTPTATPTAPSTATCSRRSSTISCLDDPYSIPTPRCRASSPPSRRRRLSSAGRSPGA